MSPRDEDLIQRWMTTINLTVSRDAAAVIAQEVALRMLAAMLLDEPWRAESDDAFQRSLTGAVAFASSLFPALAYADIDPIAANLHRDLTVAPIQQASAHTKRAFFEDWFTASQCVVPPLTASMEEHIDVAIARALEYIEEAGARPGLGWWKPPLFVAINRAVADDAAFRALPSAADKVYAIAVDRIERAPGLVAGLEAYLRQETTR